MVLLTGVAIYGSTYLIPLFVQLIQHYSPTSPGLVMAPAGVAMAIGFPIAGRLSDRIDARLLLAAGLAMFGVSMGLLAGVSTFAPFGAVAAWIALSRFGIAVLMPAANASAMRQVHPAMLAFAAPAATFLTQTGGALKVAGLAVLLQERAAFHAAMLTPLITEASPQAMEALSHLESGLKEAGLSSGAAAIGAGRQLASSIWLGAEVLAFRDCFVLITWAFAGLVFTIPFIPQGRAGQNSQKTEASQAYID